MFTKKKKIISNRQEIGNYIEGFDVYNSLFLKNLLDPILYREEYTIVNYEYRPDQIAQDFYGSTDYTAILIIQTGIKARDMKKGTKLYLLPKETVDRIINEL